VLGVQAWSSRPASGESISTLSPQSRRPSHAPSPVATRRFPVAGSTTAPERAQIAAPLSGHVLGSIRPARSLQRAFQTLTIRPVRLSIAATWPWYGGASPM
jgi:hypothetical protein